MAHEIPTKEIGELLDEVTEKMPKFMNSLMNVMFSSEAGKKMGQAVGSMYKELIEVGIPQDEALKMARDYMMTIQTVMRDVNQQPQIKERDE